MDLQAILWILGAIITLLTVMIGALAQVMWNHAKDCRDFRVSTAATNAEVMTKLDMVISDIVQQKKTL